MAPLTALSITSGFSSYLSFETLSKWFLNSSTVSFILLVASLSLVPSCLKHLYTFPILPLALPSSHSSITPSPRNHLRSNPFRNIFNSFVASLISPLILATSSFSCSMPLPLLALSLLLAFSISTLSFFLLFTFSVITSILSSTSLSLPTVHGLATPLGTTQTTHLLHSLHQHLCHLTPAPFPSTLPSLTCFLFVLHPLFLIHQPLPSHPRHPPFSPHFHSPSSPLHIQSHAYRPMV